MSERERKAIEGIARRFELSFAEVVRMLHAVIVSELDPIEAEGEVYEWPTKFSDDLQWLSEPPAPDAIIDIARAQEQAIRDAKVCAYLLETHPDIPTLLRVHENSLRWFKFFAVRDPNAEARAGFASEAKRADLVRDRLAEHAQEMLDRRSPRPGHA